MGYECEIVELPEQMVLSIRKRAKPEDIIGAVMNAARAVEDYLGRNDRDASSGPPLLICHGEDDQGVDVELCYPVSREIPGDATVSFGRLPATKAAACIHAGPYEGRLAAYDALKRWMKDNGHEPAGPVYEINLDEKPPGPEETRFRIAFPLKAP
ncbi:MAG: GyrI-like domain-containing protein [Elusimicrobia bacterium]|nr:GyrI-like domain-containing protein [Elusimicrobiota bacterium]